MENTQSKSSRPLKSHNKVDKLFRCQHCNKEFPKKKLCIEHERLHTGEELPFECPQCLKKFNKSWSLKRHVAAVHTQARPFCCHLCPKTFKHLWHLNGHILSAHSENQTLFPCSNCSKVFVLATSLQRHMRLGHRDQTTSLVEDTGQENSLPTPINDPPHIDQLFDQFSMDMQADMKHFILDIGETGEPSDTVHVEVTNPAEPDYVNLSHVIPDEDSKNGNMMEIESMPVVVEFARSKLEPETEQMILNIIDGQNAIEADKVKMEDMTQPMKVKFELNNGHLFSALSDPTERWKINMMGSDDEE